MNENKLSTDELFHFTSFENLKLILDSSYFYPKYNLEYTLLSTQHDAVIPFLLIPMVCFCDIPLNLVSKHQERYGKCGIGLKKSWAMKNGLNPVIYIQSDSHLGNIFSDLGGVVPDFIPIINDHYKSDLRIPQVFSYLTDSFRYLSYFLKQIENKKEITFQDGDKKVKFEKRKFYDEREWRYIPFEAELDNNLFQPVDNYKDDSEMQRCNTLLKNYRLNFNIADISHIFVENREQELEIKSILENKTTDFIDLKIGTIEKLK